MTRNLPVKTSKTPGAANRVRRAWKSLRLTKNIDGSLFSIHQISDWVRNLLDDGDIESNPGPHQIPMFNQNIASAPNCWSQLRRCSIDQWDVLMLQETNMTLKEQTAFGRYAWKSGYRCFHLPARCTNGKPHHGIGILVRKSLKSRLLSTKDIPLAQVSQKKRGVNLQ